MRTKQTTRSTVPVLKSIPDAARDWFGNISTRYVYVLIAEEKLRATRIGRRVFIAEDDAREMVEQSRRRPLPRAQVLHEGEAA